MNKPRILIMAGGTGGHVFPALAIARHLAAKGWDVQWLGTASGLEAKIVPNAGFLLYTISIKGVRRMGVLGWLLLPFQLLRAFFQALRLIHTIKPDVILGMGGFASGPGGAAAWVLRCPLVIHEQNSIVGMTNRYLSRIASQVLEAFPNAFNKKAGAIYTGNPIRDTLLNLPLPRERFQTRTGPLRVLILGGSQGARALNQLCPLAFQTLAKDKAFEIWHQCGGGHEMTTRADYEKANVSARVEPFIEDMAAAYAWADLVICRSGALTVSELAAVGVASILIPFPYAVDDHQTHNGRFLEHAGAAKLISQFNLSKEKLATTLLELSADRQRLLTMAEAAYNSAKRDALFTVAAYCEELGNRAAKKS